MVHASLYFPDSLIHLSAFPPKQVAISPAVLALSMDILVHHSAFSLKWEEKVQREGRSNSYHFCLSDIPPCTCLSHCFYLLGLNVTKKKTLVIALAGALGLY